MTATTNTAIDRRENGLPPPQVPLADVDLGSVDFWAADDDYRDGAFATLRREAPVKYFEAPDFVAGFPTGAGHWALTRHADVHFASRHPDLFSSSPTSTSLNDVAPEIAEYLGSMITLDDPRHLRLRGIVNRAFTPKVLARLEQSVRDRSRQLVAELRAGHPDGHADFVESLSGPLPLQIICDLMGIPAEDEAKVFHWTTVIMGSGDEEASGITTRSSRWCSNSASMGCSWPNRGARTRPTI